MHNFKEKLKLLSYFTSYNIVNKGIMFLAGILVVRYMDKTDYAYYTLTHSLMGSMTSLSTLGAGTALLSLGGKSVGDPVELGVIRATVIRYRQYFTAIVLPIITVILIYFLSKTGCPPFLTAILLLLACLNFSFQFQKQIATTILKLKREYLVPQKIGLKSNVARLIALILLIPFCFTSWCVLGVTVCIGAITCYYCYLPLAKKHFSATERTSPKVGKEIRRITYNTLPGTMMAFVMPNLSLFLITYFGQTENVAELGALGRIALIYSIPGAIAVSIFQPWISSEGKADRLRYKILLFFLAMTGAGFALLLGAFFARDYILLILGSGYSYLGYELILFAGLSCFTLSLESLRLSLDARGWVDYFWLNPIINIASMIVGLAVFRLDLSLLSGVILLSFFRIPAMFLHFSILLRRGFLREFKS